MIFYIRHAEYIGSILGSSTGSIYQELTVRGRQSCLANRSSLPSSVSQTVISSTAGRAMETAALLFPGSQIQLVDFILETDGGPLSLVPEFYVSNSFGIENTPLRQYPGAESNIAMFNRVLSYHSKLLSSFSQDSHIFVVCHSGPISSIAKSHGLNLRSIPFLGGISVNKNNGRFFCEPFSLA